MRAYEPANDPWHDGPKQEGPTTADQPAAASAKGGQGVAAGAGMDPAAGQLMSHWADDGGAKGGGLRSPRFAGDPDFEAAAAGKRALRPGWGNAGTVIKLQQSLSSLGMQLGTADGQWGPKTSAAVQQLQSSLGTTPDAVIGPQTMHGLDQADAQGAVQTPAGGGAAHGGATHGPPGDNGADQETKGPAHKPPPVPPPDPAKAAEEEAKFAGEGQAAIAAIRAAGGPMSASGGGHTKGGPVAGFPDWFSELQQLLVGSASWGDTEEKSQNVLYRYAMWKTQLTQGKVAPNLEVFFRYIGRSEANDPAARKGGYKSTNDIGGKQGNQNWCQAASTAAVEIALKERGLKFKGGAANWINNRSIHKGVPGAWSRSAFQTELAPGDWVSYVSPIGPETGHAVTVLDVSGDTFTHASGNAGGEAARVGQSKRGVPPASYNIDAVVTWVNGGRQGPAPGPVRPTQDEVWTFSVTKVSNLFAELERVDQVDPTSPEYAAVLKDLGLERLK